MAQAFLRQVKGLSPGQPILVQVTGYAEPGKALPCDAKDAVQKPLRDRDPGCARREYIAQYPRRRTARILDGNRP